MSLRERLVENFVADLEYHPRRGAVYLVLAAFAFLVFFSSSVRTTAAPLVALFGSLSLLLKAIFLFRRSSEGLGLSQAEIGKLSQPSNRKELPPFGSQAAQMVQDFGIGPFLLWPLLEVGKDMDEPWSNPVGWRVFIVGAAFFFIGWFIRRTITFKEGPARPD